MRKIMMSLIGIFCVMFLAVSCGNNVQENKESNDNNNGKKEVIETSTSEENSEEIEMKIAVGTVAATGMFDLLEIDLVGVPQSSRALPSRYDQAARIGLPMKPDMEILKSLDTDIFITDSNFKNSLEKQLKEQGIEALFISNASYDDVKNNLKMLGEKFNKEEKAMEIINGFDTRVEKSLEKKEGKDAPKVMILFGTPESFMMATNKSFIGNVVNMMGGVNVTDSMEKVFAPFVPFSIEEALNYNPDVILRLTHASPEVSRKMFNEEFSKNKVWQSIDAVKNEKVYDLDNEYYGVTANIKAVDAIEKMAEMLYGE